MDSFYTSKTFCKCGLALRANVAITSQQQRHNRLEKLQIQLVGGEGVIDGVLLC